MSCDGHPRPLKKMKGTDVINFMKDYIAKEGCDEQALAEAFGHVGSLKDLKPHLDGREGFTSATNSSMFPMYST